VSVTTTESLQGVGPTSAYVTVGAWVRAHKWPLMVTGLFICALYASNFAKLFSDWKSDENYSHGFVVPLAFFWMLWQRRTKLARAEYAPQTWALAIVALGLLQLAAGTWGAENFIANSSLLVLLCGISLFLFGTELFRLLAFPIGWLLFMIPLPSIIFYAITFPLQLLASKLAVGLLDLVGVPSMREGNVLYLANFTAGVVEACSGIRSLISVLAFAVLLSHAMNMSQRSRWMLAGAAVPIALAMNAVRIAGTGVIGNYFGAQSAEGFFHVFSGWLLFMGCLGLTFLVAQFLSRFESRRNAGRMA
jgi:exosortase